MVIHLIPAEVIGNILLYRIYQLAAQHEPARQVQGEELQEPLL